LWGDVFAAKLFAVQNMTFKAADVPDLKDEVTIVTGASGGIGKASALESAK